MRGVRPGEIRVAGRPSIIHRFDLPGGERGLVGAKVEGGD